MGADEKSRLTWNFSRLSLSGFMSYLPLLSFGPSAIVTGSAYLLLRLSASECLTSVPTHHLVPSAEVFFLRAPAHVHSEDDMALTVHLKGDGLALPAVRRSRWQPHRDLQARLDTAIPTAAANRDQDRYIMITFPTSQIQKYRSFSPVVDPPRRRSRKCTLAISTCAPIFIAQGGYLRSQRPVHAR